MKSFLTGLTIVVASVSLSAIQVAAFQETTITPSSEGVVKPVPKVDPSVDLGGSGVEFNATGAKQTGTVISIPGIGKLGTLPKLDFGLELLYSDDKPETADTDATNAEDVLVRGSIKHRF